MQSHWCPDCLAAPTPRSWCQADPRPTLLPRCHAEGLCSYRQRHPEQQTPRASSAETGFPSVLVHSLRPFPLHLANAIRCELEEDTCPPCLGSSSVLILKSHVLAVGKVQLPLTPHNAHESPQLAAISWQSSPGTSPSIVNLIGHSQLLRDWSQLPRAASPTVTPEQPAFIQ